MLEFLTFKTNHKKYIGKIPQTWNLFKGYFQSLRTLADTMNGDKKMSEEKVKKRRKIPDIRLRHTLFSWERGNI